jgi:pimeloyl-ACP methyl ester carboxylesterase
MALIHPFLVRTFATSWMYARLLNLMKVGSPISTIEGEFQRLTGIYMPIRVFQANPPDPFVFYGNLAGKAIYFIGPTPSSAAGLSLYNSYNRPAYFNSPTGLSPFIADRVERMRLLSRDLGIGFTDAMCIVGYSMGGAIATAYAAQRFAIQGQQGTVWCSFGAPKCGIERFKPTIEPTYGTRWMNVGDPVPLIMPTGEEASLLSRAVINASVGSFNPYKHWYPGFVLGQNTNWWVLETAAQFAGDYPSALLNFLIASTSAPANEHSISLYESRLLPLAMAELARADAAAVPQGGVVGGGDDLPNAQGPPPRPPNVIAPPRLDIVVPPIPAAPEGGWPRNMRNDQNGGIAGINFGPAPPVGNRRPFYAARQPFSRKWGVYYGAIGLVEGLNRKRARHLARRMNDAADVFTSAPLTSPGSVLLALGSELGAT